MHYEFAFCEYLNLLLAVLVVKGEALNIPDINKDR